MGRTGERAWRNSGTDAPKRKLNQTQKSVYTGKRKKCAWRNTDAPKKKPNQTQKSGYNMGKTREPAWRNTDTQGKTRKPAWGNTDRQKKKLKQTQTLICIDDDGSDDDDDDHDDDVEVLDTKEEQCELDENASSLSDILEKFSSPQSGTICVQGYKVKESNATILEAIFKKHGDIAAECVFKTNSVRSCALDVVCEVVRQIQTNDVNEKLEELEGRVSDAEAANVDVTWLRAHLEAHKKRKETSKRYNMHMGMKENVILVKKVALMDLREICSELVDAQQRFKQAETSVRVLDLVEKNLNDHILESKAKIDSWIDHPVV